MAFYKRPFKKCHELFYAFKAAEICPDVNVSFLQGEYLNLRRRFYWWKSAF